MNKLLVKITVCLIASTFLFAGGVTKTGTTAVGFLAIDVGSRATAMGGAYVAVAQDATAMFWNPAGITSIGGPQAMFQYAKWIADLQFNYVAFVLPIETIGSFGLNVTSLTMDDMERTTIAYPEGTGEMFSAGSYALGLSYARKLTERFSIGFNFKYLNETIYHSSASGIAFDIGTLFTTRLNGMKIGMSISNYGPKVKMSGRDMLTQVDIDPTVEGNNENLNADLKTGEFDLPLIFRVGVSMDMLKGTGNSNLILSADALHPNDDVESVNLGAEYIFNDFVSLRAGYPALFSKDSFQGISLGAGLNYTIMGSTRLTVDYAYRDFGLLNNVQMFTLGLNF